MSNVECMGTMIKNEFVAHSEDDTQRIAIQLAKVIIQHSKRETAICPLPQTCEPILAAPLRPTFDMKPYRGPARI